MFIFLFLLTYKLGVPNIFNVFLDSVPNTRSLLYYSQILNKLLITILPFLKRFNVW